jgi:hypothetical protein
MKVTIIIIIIIIIITVVLLRCHAAEDAGITILRKVGKYLTLKEAFNIPEDLYLQHTSIYFYKMAINSRVKKMW